MEQGEPFEHEEPPAFRPPPPQDDRLWRHPSELAWQPPSGSPPTRPGWPGAVASGLLGVLVTVGLLAAAGAFDGSDPKREVVVREAVRPAIASMSTRGSSVAAMAGDVAPAIVRLDVTGDDAGTGSGVLFRDDGHVLTSAQVVADAAELTAVLASGETVGARVVGVHPDTDVAVVKLDGDGPWPTAALGTTEGLAVGDPAIAVGTPRGPGREASSVTVGVVSAVGRQITLPQGAVLSDMVQTDAAITSGSSGGALLDRSGSVIGVITAFAVTEPGDGGLGFATPVDVARAVADDLIALGRARQVWFGVRGSGEHGSGVELTAVVDGGPADQGGMRAGDVVRRVDGRPVGTMSSLRVSLLRHHPGETVVVVYDRDRERRTARVTLGERPTG